MTPRLARRIRGCIQRLARQERECFAERTDWSPGMPPPEPCDICRNNRIILRVLAVILADAPTIGAESDAH